MPFLSAAKSASVMTSSLSLLGLTVLVFALTAIECRSVPDTDTLMPVLLDSMGNPLMIVRGKRGSLQSYPRTMMFTGLYRPPRRSGSNSQATSIYAEGNAIGGGAYFSQPVHLADGPDPADDTDISSSVAEAHPDIEDDDEHRESPVKSQDNEMDEDQKRPVQKPSKGQKKGKNTPIDEDEDDEYDDEDDEEYRGSSKARGRKQYRPANNYFPMVFSFPGSTSRRGSSESGSGGPVTAVANSYSTSKGGVASSVATAYGGSSMKKPRRRFSS